MEKGCQGVLRVDHDYHEENDRVDSCAGCSNIFVVALSVQKSQVSDRDSTPPRRLHSCQQPADPSCHIELPWRQNPKLAPSAYGC